MGGRATLALAGVMFAGALAAGYWGLAMSRGDGAADDVQATPLVTAMDPQLLQEQLRQRAEREQRSPVVVFARDIQPMVPLSAEDLAVEQLRLAPAGSFASPEALLGRVVWHRIPAGSLASEANFEVGGPLARMIRPDERALAIAVDEVVSGGGHVRPGDYVDVLLYLNKSEKNVDQTVQVVIPALRVLSSGETLGTTPRGELVDPPPPVDPKEAPRSRRDLPRTVVLAVPAPLMSRFMLASQVGSLRLAVRSVEEKLLAGYYAGAPVATDVEEINRQLFQFEKLALSQVRQPQRMPSPGLVPARPAGVPVIRGTDVSRLNF